MQKNINRENIDIMTSFFRRLEQLGTKDKDVYFITADHGAWALSQFRKNLKNQFMNIGISEQNMISVAAGMALNKKKIFLFTITPFITQRCLEQIKIDICFSNLPVTIIGNGSSLTYAHHGTSHQAIEDIAMMRVLPDLKIVQPYDNFSAKKSAEYAYRSKQPVYIKLDKGFFPDINKIANNQLNSGYIKINSNFNKTKKKNICLITTGVFVHEIVKIQKKLKEKKIDSTIINVFEIKPFNKNKIKSILKNFKAAFTIEEQHIDGGLGGIVSEIIAEEKINLRFKRIGINDFYSKKYGDRIWLRKVYNLDNQKILKIILQNI